MEIAANTGDRVAGAVSKIAGLIRDSGLKPGDRLPSEAVLSESLSVSRTVVREALRSLAAVRLIDLGAGKRPTVAELDDSSIAMTFSHGVVTDQIDIRQIYDARRTIEARTANLAALRRSPQEADEILAHARAMQNNLDHPEIVMEHDIALHAAIAKASQNPVFALIIGAFRSVIVESWPVGWKARANDAERETMNRLHLELAEAIAAGDPPAAAALMEQHFDLSLKALSAAGIV